MSPRPRHIYLHGWLNLTQGLPLNLALGLALCTALFSLACATVPSDSGPTVFPTVFERRGEPLDAQLPVDPEVRRGQLDNGLRYYLRAHRRPQERAELRLFIDVGSIVEADDERGLAHFVEHMAFNGTRRFPKQELVDYLERIGTRFGADLNAFTSFDETGYKLRVPTDDDELLARGFEILAEWAHGVSFDPVEVEKERGVIIEEWRQGRGARARVSDQQLPVLLHGSRYAERLPIGQPTVIEATSTEALRRFYRRWYRPDLMAVVAVGDFEVDRVERLIRETFGQLDFGGREPPEDAAPRPDFDVPGHAETLISRVTDPELSRTDVAVHYKHPPQPEGTYGDYRRSLVQSLYHSMLNGRLAELARDEDPPFLYGVSGMGSFARAATFYSQRVGVRDGEALRGLTALLREVERVDRHGFTGSELERAKSAVQRDYEQAFRERETADSRRLAAEYGRHFLEDEPIPGIEMELELIERFLPTIELDEVNEAARGWITDDSRVILVSGPESPDAPSLPSEDELLAAFLEVEASPLEVFSDRTRDEPLVPEMPTPGQIVAEQQMADLGVTEWRLGNGVRVVVKPTDFQNDQILLGAFSPGGHSLVADEHHASASLATALVAESGLGQFDKTELGKALQGELAVVQAHVTELEEGLRGSAAPQDLETLFQLVYLSFTAPRLDASAAASFLTRMDIAMENRDSRPHTAYLDRLADVLSQGHPRRRPFTSEFLDEVDPSEAFRIYRERFADASDFTFVFVGSVDLGALRPLVETYLATLPATQRKETWRDLGVRAPGGVTRFEVRRGLEPQSQVDLHFTGPAEWSREQSHQLASLARVLQIRLRELLREQLGGTYGVRVAGSLLNRPVGRHQVSVSFGCAPDQVDTLVDAVFAEIESLRTEGPEENVVQKIRQIQRRQRELDVKTNAFWLQGLESYYVQGLDPRRLLEYDELVAGVTPESLRAAASRYLDPERYVLGVLYPNE